MGNQDSDDLRSVLLMRMKTHGLNVSSWTDRAKMPESTLRNFLAGRSDNITYSTLVSLARAIELNVASLVSYGRRAPEQVPISHETDCERWVDHMFVDHEEQFQLYLPKDPRYPNVRRTGVLIGDNSIDRIYPQGTIVVAADIGDVGRRIIAGDRVLCVEHKAREESSANPDDRERGFPDLERTTVREVHEEHGTLWLMLRSSSPRPLNHLIMPRELLDDDISQPSWEHEGLYMVSIEGVIIGSYRLE